MRPYFRLLSSFETSRSRCLSRAAASARIRAERFFRLDTHLMPVLSCSDMEAFLSRCLVRSSKPLGGVSAAFPVGSTPIRLCQLAGAFVEKSGAIEYL